MLFARARCARLMPHCGLPASSARWLAPCAAAFLPAAARLPLLLAAATKSSAFQPAGQPVGRSIVQRGHESQQHGAGQIDLGRRRRAGWRASTVRMAGGRSPARAPAGALIGFCRQAARTTCWIGGAAIPTGGENFLSRRGHGWPRSCAAAEGVDRARSGITYLRAPPRPPIHRRRALAVILCFADLAPQ